MPEVNVFFFYIRIEIQYTIVTNDLMFICRCNRMFSNDAKKIPVSSPLTITKTKQLVAEKQKIEMIQKKHQEMK